MPTAIVAIIVGVIALAVGALIGQLLLKRRESEKATAAQAEANRIVAEAQTKEKEALLSAKEEAMRIRAQADAEAKEMRSEVLKLEQRVSQRDENLDRKQEAIDRRDHSLADRERRLEEARQVVEELTGQRMAELERVSHLTEGEARAILMTELEVEVREDANRLVRQIEAESRENAAPKAREILTATIQRIATDTVSESTVSVLPIPSEDMKGRIIGREGRNIRAIEAATGVDLIIDDTPDAVMLSSFDGVRREVARLALSRLISDGRIHPTRIEEVVEKSRQDVENEVRQAG
jgi:ribonuclease Y